MEPHYFGSSDKQLLGIYHPSKSRPRSHGVLLCPPGPHEYMRTHMAFRKLATMLERDGFDVLRFDYYGTGDSAGGSREGSLSEWRANIAAAMTDLKECSGVRKVSIVGLRLGASLAALTPVSASTLVLWEPVVNGNVYLNELRQLHDREYSDLLFPPRLPAQTCGGELLGFPLPPQMEADIEAVDLLGSLACRAEHVVLVVSEQRPNTLSLQSRLRDAAFSGGATLEFHHVPDEAQSKSQSGILLSTDVLEVMATALARRTG